jgi:hypothetical protein
MFAAREHARFLQEPVEGPLVGGDVGWYQIAACAIPCRKLRGKVLLNGERFLQKIMLGKVRDSKSAGTEHRMNNISLYACSDRKRVCSYLRVHVPNPDCVVASKVAIARVLEQRLPPLPT